MTRITSSICYETPLPNSSDKHYCATKSEELIKYSGIDAIVPKNAYTYDQFITEELVSVFEYEAPSKTNEYEKAVVDKALAIIFPFGPKASRIKYSYDQIEKLFFSVFIKGIPASRASAESDINPSTGSGYVRKARPAVESFQQQAKIAPVETRRSNQKLFEEHFKFLAKYYEDNEFSSMKQTLEKLCEEFPGLTITVSGLYSALRKKCCVIIKRVKIESKQNADSNIFSFIKQLDISKELAFVTTTTFYMYKRDSFGWAHSSAGKEESILAKEGGVFFTVMAVLCSEGVIHVALTTDIKGSKNTPTKKASTQFMKNALDILEKNKIEKRYFIAENFSTFEIASFQGLLGPKQKCISIPDAFVTAQFWDKFKNEISRQHPDELNLFLPRLTQAAKKISTEDCNEWSRFKNIADLSS